MSAENRGYSPEQPPITEAPKGASPEMQALYEEDIKWAKEHDVEVQPMNTQELLNDEREQLAVQDKKEAAEKPSMKDRLKQAVYVISLIAMLMSSLKAQSAEAKDPGHPDQKIAAHNEVAGVKTTLEMSQEVRDFAEAHGLQINLTDAGVEITGFQVEDPQTHELIKSSVPFTATGPTKILLENGRFRVVNSQVHQNKTLPGRDNPVGGYGSFSTGKEAGSLSPVLPKFGEPQTNSYGYKLDPIPEAHQTRLRGGIHR